jgi:hypothetical protein
MISLCLDSSSFIHTTLSTKIQILNKHNILKFDASKYIIINSRWLKYVLIKKLDDNRVKKKNVHSHNTLNQYLD